MMPQQLWFARDSERARKAYPALFLGVKAKSRLGSGDINHCCEGDLSTGAYNQ